MCVCLLSVRMHVDRVRALSEFSNKTENAIQHLLLMLAMLWPGYDNREWLWIRETHRKKQQRTTAADMRK